MPLPEGIFLSAKSLFLETVYMRYHGSKLDTASLEMRRALFHQEKLARKLLTITGKGHYKIGHHQTIVNK